MTVDRVVLLGVAALAGLVSAVVPAAAQEPPVGESSTPAPAVRALDDEVRLNQVQVIGSHNSYHEVPPDPETEIRRSFIGAGDDLLQYRHAPLPVQFQSQKVRQIELDLFLDTAGGKYADPLLRSVAGGGPYDPAMNEPGIKVLHVQDVDYHSTCLSLEACLGQIESWSDANPTHLPIAILLELKDDEVPLSGFPFVVPDPFDTPAAMDSLDAEIRSVMDPSDLITPDDVRGGRATLDEAVTTDGWPTLGESRGKVMFLMDNGGSYRTTYLTGHPSLAGRVLFTNANPGDADAGFVERNDSSNIAGIQTLVSQGYVVRTRADSETTEARENDTSKRDDALTSGAQWVSTDYPVRDYGVGFETDYVAEIPGGTVARCNPVNAPATCQSAPLDTIFTPVQPPPVVTTSTSSTTTSTVPTTPPPTTTPPTVVPATEPPRRTVAPAQGAQAVSGRPNYTG